MRIQGDDPVIDTLLQGDDEAVFVLISLMRRSDTALLYSDGRSYLTAQTNPTLPIWIYVNEHANARTEEELCAILREAFAQNPNLRINAQPGFAEDVLRRFAQEAGARLSEGKTLYAYTCAELTPVPPVGQLVASAAKYKDDIVRLIKQAGDTSDEAAARFAEAHVGSKNLFLWQDGGIVSMARIADEGPRYSRINAVVTERERRNHGYAKMVVGEAVKHILARGNIAQLYSDAANPCSNRAYQALGFRKVGELKEYSIQQ